MPPQINGRSKTYMYRVMLVASKKAGMKKWLSQTPPSSKDWFNVRHDIFVMEMRLKSDVSEDCWRSWIEIINPFRLDFR